jgi:hypothetical protein
MVFPILGGNSAVAGGYAIDNSLRFNDDDTARLTRTPSANGNQKTFTTSFWVKKGNISDCTIFSFGTGTTYNISVVEFGSEFFLATTQVGVTQVWSGKSEGKYRDVSAWYHVVIAIDTTQATSSNRVKAYINGNFVSNQGGFTYPSQNYNAIQNPQTTWAVGSRYDGNNPADMYLAEIHHIDGQQLDASSFGEFDEDSGIWKPIEYSGSYGTNGFYLDFENSGSLGADQSGNGNNFTPTNLASTDQTTDTPTNNWCTLNPLDTPSGSTFSEGNLKIDTSVGQQAFTRSTIGVQTGKWYFEAKITTSNVREAIGIYKTDATLDDGTARISYYSRFGHILKGNDLITTGATFGNGDIIGTAFDLDASTVSFYKNGSLQGTVTSIDSSTWTPMFQDASDAYACGAIYNFGNPPTGFTVSSGNTDDNGYGNFEYAPPTGFLSLCTQNLATELSPTIDDGSQYFNTVLYTGTSTTNRTVTGVGFQPDFTWFKGRTPSAIDHALFDSNRGATKILISNNTNAEITVSESLKSFNSDGVTLGNDLGDYGVNNSARTYALWSWKANTGSTSSNTDGSITSTVQANTTAGFSIVTYTGNGTSGATVGHGLGKVPSMVVTKARNDSPSHWRTYHIGLIDYTYAVTLNDTHAQTTGYGLNASPTSSVFELTNSSQRNQNTINYIAYCFAEIEGYSKFGKYTGNGSTDGTFVYTGFRPAFVIIKVISTTENWVIRDNKRDPYNNVYHQLLANASSAEDTTNDGRFSQDFLSNGFKIRASHATTNQSGQTYIYMAFAENPFVSSTGIPVTAR